MVTWPLQLPPPIERVRVGSYTIALAPSAPAMALRMAIASLMMVSHFDFVSGFIVLEFLGL